MGTSARWFARTSLIALVLWLTSASVVPTCARATTVLDRRVTALTAAELRTRPTRDLIDPRRQRVASVLRFRTHVLYWFWSLSQIGALYALWASGTGARARDGLRRVIPNAFAQRFAYGAALAYVAGLASVVASFARFRTDLGYGVSTEHALAWVRDGTIATTVDALVIGTIVATIFALVDRTRLWYLYAMGGLFVATLLLAFVEPVTVAPLYNRFVPLAPHAAIRAPLDALARRAGIVGAPIYVADLSRRSSSVTADIAGFGPTKRIVLGDALLADATPGEVLFLASREFGHYAHGDDFRLSLLWTFLFIFATTLAVLVADRVPLRRDDDALARLPLVFALMGIAGLALAPAYNAYSRNIESRADAYALALTHDRTSAVRAYVRIADETLAPLCPSRLARLYFSNSPPLGTRIAKARGLRDPCS